MTLQIRSLNKSRHAGFVASISAGFFFLEPPLIFFFGNDGVQHRRMLLVPNKPLAAVLLREATDDAGAMLPNALRQIRCDAGVERAVSPICQDVDRRLLHGVVPAVDSSLRYPRLPQPTPDVRRFGPREDVTFPPNTRTSRIS